MLRLDGRHRHDLSVSLRGKCRANGVKALAWLFVALSHALLQRCEAASMKSVQVWAPQLLNNDGSDTFNFTAPPAIYALNLESDSATSSSAANAVDGLSSALPGISQPSSGARAQINPWTFVGCFVAIELSGAYSGMTPLTCVLRCSDENMPIAAMKRTSCYCRGDRSFVVNNRDPAPESRCDLRCSSSYSKGTRRLCGGTGAYVSVYEQYSMVHQTAQGCYDPWRFIWYQSVAIELPPLPGQEDEPVGDRLRWFLHAASINSGDPIFPYQRPLDSLILGLQYDLDNSRVVGYHVPYWSSKSRGTSWTPSVEMHRVNSLNEDDILFTTQKIPYTYEGSDVSDFLLGSGVSALDPLHNVYYLVMPVIPQTPGELPSYTNYGTMIYGINLNTELGERVVLKREVGHRVIALESNSKYHDLFALILQETPTREFFYVKLGNTYLNNRSEAVEFEWTFSTPLDSVVNPFTYQQFTDKYFQMGASAVDHISNTSYFVFKDRPDGDAPYTVEGIHQRGFLQGQNLPQLSSPEVQGTWLVNTDPRIPLTLAAPQLVSANFAIDARSIIVQLDAYTVQGALPLDSDGDYIPDSIDWSTQHVGMRECSDIFARQTAEQLGSMPQTKCEWQSGTTIQIHLSKGFDGVTVGDPLFLKDRTIYVYLADENSWSMAASGGINIGLPIPLLAPYIDISYSENVDLCSPVTLDGLKSYRHGDRPVWQWRLASVTCLGAVPPNQDLTQWVEDILSSASRGSEDHIDGTHVVEFGKDDLEPGCTYVIGVTLSGRWGLSSSREISVFKQSIPAPQVYVLGPRLVFQTRARVLALQMQVAPSECESLLLSRVFPRFEWSAMVEGTEEVGSRPVDFAMLGDVSGIETGALLVPPLNLVPAETYTFALKVGYENTWDVDGATTTEQVQVTVVRSPIKVNIVGGNREVQLGRLVAIDATSSVDPDFPDQLIANAEDWSFSYRCTTIDGEACFPHSSSNEMNDVTGCRLGQDSFIDLGTRYPTPSFSSSELYGDAYYCRHPTMNGILLLSTEKLLAKNYTFTVLASSHGRAGVSSLTLEVLPGDVALPSVRIQPLGTAKVLTTQSLRIVGDLIPEDRAQYSSKVTWSWAFFREESNPRYSDQAAKEAALEGKPYLMPEKIYVDATEINADAWGTDTFQSQKGSNNLVLQPNILQPSNTYSFRLSASTSHPYNQGQFLVGYADVKVDTAGPPPVPGALLVDPPVESYTNQKKTLTATDWSAQDVPISFTFGYRADLQSAFSEIVELRVGPFSAPSQPVSCLRAGEPADNYSVELSVVAYTLYGASTRLTRRYRSLPPRDPPAANAELLALVEQVDPQSRASILNCIWLGPPASVVVTTDENGTTVVQESPTPAPDREALAAQADQMVDILDEAARPAAVTAATLSSNLQALQRLAESGVVSNKMVTFASSQADDAALHMETAADSDEARDQIALQVFNTLGSMGLASVSATQAGIEAQGRSVAASDPDNGAFFPSSAASPTATGSFPVRRIVASGGSRSVYDQSARRLHQLNRDRNFAATDRRKLNMPHAAARGISSSWSGLAGNVAQGARRLNGLHNQGGTSQFKSEFSLKAGAFPDWTTLPETFRSDEQKAMFSRTVYAARDGKRLALGPQSASSALEDLASQFETMYEAQEALEEEWLAFIRAASLEDSYQRVQLARDEEYFANYSAHLPPEEREAVQRRWWEERARREAKAAAQTYTQAQLSSKMLKQFAKICAVIVKFMVNGESAKEFVFPMGSIRVGKARDLGRADSSFSFADPRWKIAPEATGAFGWLSVKFTQANPLSWGKDSPKGPFLVNMLEVFADDGTILPVDRQALPVNIMSEHSSFASAGCFFWDWQENAGLGGWSRNGVVNNDQGCSSTHLSVIGMFLDGDLPAIELPTTAEAFLQERIITYNYEVIFTLGGALALIGLVHFCAFRQDGADRLKPVEMKKLGDGLSKPRSQDDPVYYSDNGAARILFTFFNIVMRDHLLVACFCRCQRLRVTRLQKVSVLFSTLAGTAAVAALFYGEHVVDPRHYVEVGVIAAVLTFPMVGMLAMLFASRPARDGAQQYLPALFGDATPKEGEFHGVLEALPVPEDEQESEDQEYDEVEEGPHSAGADGAQPAGLQGIVPVASGGGAGSDLTSAPQALSAALQQIPVLQPVSPMQSSPSAPEAGGGPSPLLRRAPTAASLLQSGALPPRPPEAASAAQAGSVSAGSTEQQQQQTHPPSASSARPQAARNLSGIGPPPATGPPTYVPSAARTTALTPPRTAALSPAPRTPPPPPPPATSSGLAAARGNTGAIVEQQMRLPGAAASDAEEEATTHAADEPEGVQPVGTSSVPPAPPLAGPRGDHDGGVSTALALREPEGGAIVPLEPLTPAMPAPVAENSAAAEAAQAQAQLLRRVRRMYIEKVIQNSERLAYDERVDIKSSVPHPMAMAANALAHIAVASYWIVALCICCSYAVHFGESTAKRWSYACLSGWAFTCFILEVVKIALATILELSLWAQRRRSGDAGAARERAERKKNVKFRQMEAVAGVTGVHLSKNDASGLFPPPLPPEPPPGRGDASAG